MLNLFGQASLKVFAVFQSSSVFDESAFEQGLHAHTAASLTSEFFKIKGREVLDLALLHAELGGPPLIIKHF